MSALTVIVTPPADWTAIVAPIAALAGGLGGYWLAGRNEAARDIRALQRETRARRDALAERLEEDRHAFQRDTMLELQDELQRYVRNAAQVNMQDRATIKEHGQMYLLGGKLGGDEARQIVVSLSRLRARLLDDGLRQQIQDFMLFRTSQELAMIEAYPGGTVPADQTEAALAQLNRQSLDMANAYERLTNALGVHLRRELDRRYLAAEPEPASGASR